MRTSARVWMLFGFLLLTAAPAGAQQSSAPDSTKGPHLMLVMNMSMMNSFANGNLDDFFHQISGDVSRDVDAGSPAYIDLGAVLWMPHQKGYSGVGVGVGFELYNNHAFWGTKLDFGGRAEIALQPFSMYTSLPIRVDMSQNGSMLFAADPSLLISFITGHVTLLDGTYYELSPGVGLGGKLPIGLDIFPTPGMGFSFRVGYRFVKADVLFKDDTSSTGYSQFLVNGEKVKADMSGVFMTTAIIIRF